MTDVSSDPRERLEAALTTRALGRRLTWLDNAPSTNDVARELAVSGVAHGALVLADHQTTGRGRHGRIWRVEPGQNLTFSLVLRPRLVQARLGLVTFAASLAVANTIRKLCPGLSPGIKWPNDILLEGRKCCGMLPESSARGNGSQAWVVLGIGLNVNQRTFPPEFEDRATSLVLEYGQFQDRVALLTELLQELELWLDRIETDPEAVVSYYEELLMGLNHPVSVAVMEGGETVEGVMRGVDSSGALLVDTVVGRRTLHAGDVTLRAT